MRLSALRHATAALPDVTHKRMFGCDVFLVRGKMFALIHDDRIVLKISALEPHNELMTFPGTLTWTPGGPPPMLNWIVLPPDFAARLDLAHWVAVAHAAVLAEAMQPQRKRKRNNKTSE